VKVTWMRVKRRLVTRLQQAEEVLRIAQMSEMERYVKRVSLMRSLLSVAMKSCSVEAISVSYRGG
jgi:hypothetical protein